MATESTPACSNVCKHWLALGFCREADIGRAYAEQLEIPFVDLSESFPPPPTLQLVRKETARQWQLVPARKEGNRLIIEPAKPKSLLALLATWEPIVEEFPDIEDLPPDPVDV